jgi:hypothetical protein
MSMKAGGLQSLFFDREDGGNVSLETLADVQWTMWCYTPGKRPLHNHSCENLISYIIKDTAQHEIFQIKLIFIDMLRICMLNIQ